jgi:hypothetical protein
MQYVRMLTNALVAGALVGAYVVLLVLQLNPMVQLQSLAVARLMLIWWAFYSLHAAVFFYGLIVLRQLLAVEVRPPAWVSLREQAAFGTVAIVASAIVTWLNLHSFRAVLGPESGDRMAAGTIVLTVCACVCVVLALLQLRLQRRRRLAGAVFALSFAVSLMGPLWLRGLGDTPPPPRKPVAPQLTPPPSAARVRMIVVEGASLDFLAPHAAGGQLPNFARLLEDGAVMHLATLRPTQPAPVWTAVATGKLPYKTSVYSTARYVVPASDQTLDLLPDFCFAQALVGLGLIDEQDRAADAVRSGPVWELLSRYGITAGVINWPLTYPAHGVNGYLVSDEFLQRDARSATATVSDDPLAYPPEILAEVATARVRAGSPQPATALLGLGQPGPPSRENRKAPDAALAADAASEELAHVLGDSRPTQFGAVRYAGLDLIGHYYLRYAMPGAFGDVSEEERRQHGRVLEQYYRFIDGIVGRAIGSMEDEDLLLVVSGFGMEPLSLGKRVLERVAGDRELSGSHERAPDGFVLAYGRHVSKGHRSRASVVDIAPTILYYFGLPIARDLDGFARTDIFDRSFTEARPITFIPLYDR